MEQVSPARHRRVLMLCYYFPPVQTVAIARNVGFARELPKHGWRPTVLTVTEARDSWSVPGRAAPVPTDVEVERTAEWDLDRVLKLLDAVASKTAKWLVGRRRGYWFRDLCVPDPQHGWRVRRRGAELARDCACVYVSCSPFSSALAGVSIKRRTGRPLVLDFRDAWTLNPQAPDHLPLHRWAARRMERHCVRWANRVIVNTEGALRLYREQYPEWADRFVCIPNGYDALNIPEEAPAADAPFTIMHVGNLYHSRNPEPLLRALAELDLPGVRFVQVGREHPVFRRHRDRVDIHVTGHVTRARAMEWMRSASLLYVTLGREQGNPSSIAVTAKTYEYLATGLPVLADCPPGDNARMIERFACWPYVITEPDQDAIKAAVRDAYEQRVHRVPAVHPEFVETFSRGALTARLAAELEAVCTEATTDRTYVPGRSAEAEEARDAR